MTRGQALKVDVDGLDDEHRLKILGIVDHFRALGVNEDISLPQLVVVGDQSSGKSSLLEGLTGLNFPIASELCTRFVTQIRLRRAPADEAEAKVSILPGPSASGDEGQVAHLHSFGYDINGGVLTADMFESILSDAAVHMGLPAIDETDLEDLDKRFSDDILSIELSGPEHHHLSVVDVPGLFHNPTKYQTSEDLDTIRSLIKNYITDRRTIILAVMDARNNLANQEVFRMAREADPAGARTVGIVTKCDAVQGGDEQGVLKIAQNQVEKLTHGWFAVRNRSTAEIRDGVTIAQRHYIEKDFFSKRPWSSLNRDRVGIGPLKAFLGKLLYDHIRAEFPSLVEEIRHLANQARDDLASLGVARQTSTQQRHYLTQVAGDYQKTLRMHLQFANEKFGSIINKGGHHLAFRKPDEGIDDEFGVVKEGEENIYNWIRRTYRDSRGCELPGTVNPAVLARMFKSQSVKWRAIASKHLDIVNGIVMRFNKRVMADLVVEESLRAKITSRNARGTRQKASQILDQLLADETEGILQTVNNYFSNTLSKSREARLIHRLEAVGISEDDATEVVLSDIMDAVHLNNEDQAVFDIHDILRAYYKVALKRFADNVVVQIVERCFLGEDGPVKTLTPAFIGGMAEQELADIAAENSVTASARSDISHRLERLEKALEIAEVQAM
ncbi:P-loop containing nucleoside triphosphate hydrolase protein [Piedraia hortae CBS 480.64]|uniref:P-loop containing nucleoside triphosphate hydrolase protein n=1 Tax=Piedraia hortae CBS 480.64 TaxID=1314780 RepID=A0A6A7BQ44_9PEZI|nr:P-loop containing nucleoside triphosphate hydrolase protein [Piedraia hortae CBS 480.64]